MTDIHSCSYYCDRPECIKAQRDELRDRLAQPERHELQAKGEHPAPCARHCEATAFQIVIKNLQAQLAQPEQKPVAWMVLGDGEYGEYTPGMHFDTVGHKEYWERRGYELQPLYTAPPRASR